MGIKVSVSIILVMSFLASCGGTRVEMLSTPNVNDEYVSTEFELEKKIYRVAPDGRVFMDVVPIVESRDDLLAYRDYKVAEAKEIWEMTEDIRDELPYFSSAITFKEPVPISALNDLLMNYNPALKEKFKGISSKSNYLFKGDFVTGRDVMAIFKARFRSTMGGGEMPFDTLSNPKELGELRSMIEEKQKELNGIDNYQLIKGITSIYGAIHRDKLQEIQNDPKVFLVDIGPMELYQQVADHIFWEDVYNKLEQFYED